MKTPAEIGGRAVHAASEKLAPCTPYDADPKPYDAWAMNVIAAIEAAGFVIVDPERVTFEMADAACAERNSGRDSWYGVVMEALRAAPKWSKDA